MKAKFHRVATWFINWTLNMILRKFSSIRIGYKVKVMNFKVKVKIMKSYLPLEVTGIFYFINICPNIKDFLILHTALCH